MLNIDFKFVKSVIENTIFGKWETHFEDNMHILEHVSIWGRKPHRPQGEKTSDSSANVLIRPRFNHSVTGHCMLNRQIRYIITQV